jgi:hypothetical protein
LERQRFDGPFAYCVRRSASGATTLPTGARNIGAGAAQPEAKLAAASSGYVDGGLTLLFGDRLQVDARIGRGAGSPVASERFVGRGLARRL